MPLSRVTSGITGTNTAFFFFFQGLEAIGAVMMFRMSNESKAMLKSSPMLLLGSSLRCTLFTCYSLHTRFSSLQEMQQKTKHFCFILLWKARHLAVPESLLIPSRSFPMADTSVEHESRKTDLVSFTYWQAGKRSAFLFSSWTFCEKLQSPSSC